jgi:hypothetical protein
MTLINYSRVALVAGVSPAKINSPSRKAAAGRHLGRGFFAFSDKL